MSIPAKYLVKMGTYDVQIHGASVKARVVSDASMIELGLTELKSHMGTSDIVALAHQRSFFTSTIYCRICVTAPHLLLCVKSYCLIIKLQTLGSFPKRLKDFLLNPKYYVLGVGSILYTLCSFHEVASKNRIEVSTLAAKVLKRNNLKESRVEEIAAEVGVTLDGKPRDPFEGLRSSIDVFSHEQICFLAYEVYASYLIGCKLLGSLRVMSIPTEKYLAEMDTYDVQIHGASVKPRVVFDASMIHLGLTELKSHMGTSDIVALAHQGSFCTTLPNDTRYRSICVTAPHLLLCVESYCLMINLQTLGSFSKKLKDFLLDNEVCFLGVGMDSTLCTLRDSYGVATKNGIDVSTLAAMVLKRTNLKESQFDEIAAEVGVTLNDKPTDPFKGLTSYIDVFSQEQIRFLLYKDYASYLIGSKLLGSL